MIKAVIFDLDGTLIDGVADLYAAINTLFDEEGIAPIDEASVESFIGDGIAALVERCYRRAGAAPRDFSASVARFKAIYHAEGYLRTKLFPEVEAALRDLSGRHQLGLCTNKDELHSRAILRRCGIADLFRVVVGGDTLSARKPDVRMLLHAAEGCGAGVEEIVYVGDSAVDSTLSAAAGARFFLFAGGRHAPQPSLARDATFSDYAQLPALVSLVDAR
ncbi:MAG: HAD-IA family hydrolase [Hyphomonadaceae bacterium]